MNSDNLQIISYNVQKSHTVMESIINNPITHNVQIICIQEPPKLPENILKMWPGRDTIYPSTHTDTYPYTAIYILKSFKENIHGIDNIDIPTANVTGVRVTFNAGSQPVNFINVYNKHDSQTLVLVRDLVQRFANQPTHLLGDFNAHHPAWNPAGYEGTTELETEELVIQLLQNNYSMVSAKGIPTRYGYNSATTIDLYWLSSKVEHYDSAFCSVDDEIDTTSDHRPLHLFMKVEYADAENRKRWNLKKANWDAGRKKLLRFMQEIENEEIRSPDELDQLASHLTEGITTALDACAPQLRLTQHSKRWWTDELSDLRDALKEKWRTKLRTHLPKDILAARIARGAYKRAIRVAKAKCWKNFLENIKPNEVHKAARYVKNGGIPSPFVPPLLKTDKTLTASPEEQAQTLFKHLLQGEDINPTSALGTRPDDTLDGSFQEITNWEMTVAINKMKVGKAAGPDNIPVSAIKEFTPIIVSILTKIANSSLRLGHYPKCFKEATCIVIPKPNKKSYREASSYRPISLLNHLSKLIETVMTKRLQYELDTRKLIPSTHFGCRKGSGTDDALLYVTEFIQNAWKQKKVVTALALDAQGAFNNVIHEKLLEECRKVGLPKYLTRWIGCFLKDRKIRFKFSNYTSSTFALSKGSPQGSPISGPLYLIYNTALLKASREVIKVGYADDVLWMAAASTPKEARSLLESQLHEADDWSITHGTPLDIAKTQYVLFTKHPLKIDTSPLHWGEREIAPTRAMKYLGLMLDSRLSYKQQTALMTKRGYGAGAAIGRLANTRGGMPTRQFLMLYKTHVCAATDYGGHVWINPYKHGRAIRTLELLQNRMLRKALGAVRTTPIHMLHFDTAVLTPTERLRMKAEAYMVRTLTRSGDHPARNIVTSILRKPRKKFTSPLNAMVRNTPMLEGLKEMETIVAHPFVPWVPATLSFSRAEDKDQAKAQHTELCRQYHTSWHFYTDGSLAEGKVAAACVAKLPHKREWVRNSYRLGTNSLFTIYEAELVGVYLALMQVEREFIPPHIPTPHTVFIHSDSLAVLSAIVQLQTTKTGQYLIKQVLDKIERIKRMKGREGTIVQLNWIPGHTGIYGNELADRTANEGRTKCNHYTNIDFTLSTSYSAMRRRMRERYTAPLKIEASKLSVIKSNTSKTSAGKLTAAKTAKLLNELPRATRCLATQLRTGHFPTTKSYRYRFKLIDSPKCRTCGVDDSISHRVFICRRHIMARITLRRKITKINIRFELGPMLRNAQALQALYEFFKPQLTTYPRYSGGSA